MKKMNNKKRRKTIKKIKTWHYAYILKNEVLKEVRNMLLYGVSGRIICHSDKAPIPTSILKIILIKKKGER